MTWNLAEAKNRLTEVVNLALRGAADHHQAGRHRHRHLGRAGMKN